MTSGYIHDDDEHPQPLLCEYQKLRQRIHELEKVIEQTTDEKTAKRLDKAVTVLKVGAKLVKKALKDTGYSGLKPGFKRNKSDELVH